MDSHIDGCACCQQARARIAALEEWSRQQQLEINKRDDYEDELRATVARLKSRGIEDMAVPHQRVGDSSRDCASCGRSNPGRRGLMFRTKADLANHLATAHNFRASSVSKWKLDELVRAHEGQHVNINAELASSNGQGSENGTFQ